MAGERYRLPPVLFVGCDSMPHSIGIEDYINSDDIEDHRIAIDGLKQIARFLEQGEQLGHDPQGMKMTKHHLYGGPENAPTIADCQTARRFFSDKRNIMRVRRDVHTFIESTFGWLPLLEPHVMKDFIESSDQHISSKTKKHMKLCVRGDCNGKCS